MQISEVLEFAQDELERNLACSQGGGAEGRLRNIEAMPTAVSRLGEKALLSFASHFPGMSQKIIGASIENTPYRYIGGGSENTTVQDGEEVKKVYRKSVHWSENVRQATADELNTEHSLLIEYLGSFAVPQVTEVTAHPFKPGKRAIVTTQNHYDFEDSGVFAAYGPEIDEDRIKQLEDSHPGIQQAFADFANNSLELYKDTDLLVDTSGLNNIVIAQREGKKLLTCLDGSPVKVDKQSVVDRIVGQLTALQAI